ncbi:MAG: septum formation family protein [Pseudoclavibacter sp.]
MPSKIARAGLIGASALALTLALSGCSLLGDVLGGGGADRDDEGQVTETGTDDVFAMEVGDCLNEPDGTEISEVELVPCSEPHDYEVFAEQELPEGEFDSAAIDQAIEDYCPVEFETFVGVSYDESELYYTAFTPTATSWDSGDRLIQCIIYDDAGQTTGSLAGAGR